MVIEATRFVILDPTSEPVVLPAAMARRPDDLNGKVVGLLANGKRNADILLDKLYTLLCQRYTLKEAVRLNKGDASRPCPKHLMDQLVQRCDVVITASGD